jgi:hypothetical protein
VDFALKFDVIADRQAWFRADAYHDPDGVPGSGDEGPERWDKVPQPIAIQNYYGALKFIPNLLTMRIGKITGDGYDEFRKAGPQRDLNNDNVGRMAGNGIWVTVAPQGTNFVAALFYKVPGDMQSGDKGKVTDVVQATMFAASYTLPDTVKISAGSCTSGDNPATNLIRNIFARAELLMVKGLTLWLDLKFDGLEAETISGTRNIKALVSAGYNMDPLTINLAVRYGVMMYKAAGVTDMPMAWQIYPEVLYKINDDFTVGLDLTATGAILPAGYPDVGITIEVEPLLKLTKFNAQLSFYLAMNTLAGTFINWKVPLLIDFSFW